MIIRQSVMKLCYKPFAIGEKEVDHLQDLFQKDIHLNPGFLLSVYNCLDTYFQQGKEPIDNRCLPLEC